MSVRKTVVRLDDLKCDQTAWTTLSVLSQGKKRYKIARKAPRPPVAPARVHVRVEGRYSKSDNPYSQVWSFLSRFGTLNPRLPGLSAAQHRIFTNYMRGKRNFNDVTSAMTAAQVKKFARMVILLKKYYASVYHIVGLHKSYETLLGCGEDERAVKTLAQLTTIYRRTTMPLYRQAMREVNAVGRQLFHSAPVMRGWVAMFLSLSVERIEEKRAGKKDQRLNLQQNDVDFEALILDPTSIAADWNL
jgi:hypothetical protein